VTRAGAADPGAHPAPGSAVPGAPPPLRRPLTAADGVPDPVRPELRSTPKSPSLQSLAEHSSRGGSSSLTAAAAMVGIAAGLEIAGILTRRRRR
jgi:hypothetical protein